MGKRKRDAVVSEETPQDAAAAKSQEIQRRVVRKKLSQGSKALTRALKKSKRHEIQRLAKRTTRATSAGDSEQCTRLQREVEALKNLDLTTVADAHLRKAVLKCKELNAVHLLLDHVAAAATVADDIADGVAVLARNNVTARLYNSKDVKEQLAAVLTVLRKALGVAASNNGAAASKNKDSAQKSASRRNGESRGEGPATASEHEGTDVKGSEQAREIHRASTEDPISRPEPEEDANLEVRGGHSPPAALTASTGIADDSLTEDGSLAPSDVESEDDLQSSSSGTEDRRTVKKPTSTFLPSLMAGGYWSGSESAESLDEMQPRKNRRGQRARRAIWELKYGAGANHIRKAPREKDRGPRRGPRESGGSSSLSRKPARGHKAVPSRQSSHLSRRQPSSFQRRDAQSRPGPIPEPDRPMHPSWEAAREAKQRKEAASFKGTKTVFD